MDVAYFIQDDDISVELYLVDDAAHLEDIEGAHHKVIADVYLLQLIVVVVDVE